ncbi:type IV pilus assembly protein PilM [Patescibacteria group bacterium]|nr:MAG: type IV pilus assembly protein PilM [Patescibacteria group bacterium]
MFGLFQKSAFGLDISDISLEMVEFQKKGGKIVLSAVGRMILTKGVIEDGKILNEEKLAAAIRDLCAKTQPQKISAKQVIASLPESKIFSHHFKIPSTIPESQLGEALKFEASNVIPASMDELVFDFKIIKKESASAKTAADKQEILYVASFKSIAESYARTLRLAGLEPLALDAEALSIARSLIKVYNKDEAVLIIDIGARETALSIFDQDGIRFSRDLAIAGDYFTKIIAEKLKLSWDQAEGMKTTCGLDLDCEDGRILLVLQQTLEKISQEIIKGIRYYENETGRKVAKGVLVGGSANLTGFAMYFQDNLGIPCEWGRPWIVSDQSPISSTLLLTNAIGLALRGVESDPAKAGINLLPVGGGK